MRILFAGAERHGWSHAGFKAGATNQLMSFFWLKGTPPGLLGRIQEHGFIPEPERAGRMTDRSFDDARKRALIRRVQEQDDATP